MVIILHTLVTILVVNITNNILLSFQIILLLTGEILKSFRSHKINIIFKGIWLQIIPNMLLIIPFIRNLIIKFKIDQTILRFVRIFLLFLLVYTNKFIAVHIFIIRLFQIPINILQDLLFFPFELVLVSIIYIISPFKPPFPRNNIVNFTTIPL